MIGIRETIAIITVHKGDDESLGRFSFWIAGLMQKRRSKQHEVSALDMIGYTLDKMDGIRTEQHMYLIVRVEVFKLHILSVRAAVEVEEIKDIIVDIIYNNKTLTFIGDRMYQNCYLPF